MSSNIFDISHSKDPAKTYKKCFDESKCKTWYDYYQKIVTQRQILSNGIFTHHGNFYTATFKEIDQTDYEYSKDLDMISATHHKVKFIWKYVFLK